MLPAEHETMGVPAEAEATYIANGGCAVGAAGGSHSGRCRRARGGGHCQRVARRPLSATSASTAAGGGRGGCIAAWEVGHVEDEHEGSAEDFGG